MSLRVGRRDPKSLAGGYGLSPGGLLRHYLRRSRAVCWQAVVAVSPVHFDRGDMRGAYRVTRTVVDLLVVLAALLLARLGLTWLFVTVVTTHPPLVAAFNLTVSVSAGAVLAVATVCRTRLARRRRAAEARLDRL